MSAIAHLERKIRYFETSAAAKETIAKSEAERLKLEIELNRMYNSEDALTKTKAQKLKAYLDKLTQDEAKSFNRNQQILADLKRVDTQFQQLETKLERLSHVKKEMENYIKTAYPKWTNEQKLFDPSQNLGNGLSARENSLLEQLGGSRGSLNQLDYDEKTSSRTIGALMEALRPKKLSNDRESQLAQSPPASPTKNSAIKSASFAPSSNASSPSKAASVVESPRASKTSSQQKSPKLSAPHLVHLAAEEVRSNSLANKEPKNEELLQSGTIQAENYLLKEYEQDIKRRDTTMLDFNASSTINLNPLDDFRTNQINMWSSSKSADANLNPPSSQLDNKVGQDLNLTGLYNLLDLVEKEINQTIHPENFYRQVEPHYKNKLEIIRLARDNKPLNQIDPTEISMVILDQLPIVVEKFTRDKCLFTRDLLGLSVTDISEKLVAKSLRDESDKQFWRRLVKHWSSLHRNNKIAAPVLARLFAPSLLGYSNSSAAEKAVKFVEKIINDSISLEGSGSFGETSKTERSLTETSINQELLMASSSKLKESSFYQDFIQNTQSSSKLKQLAKPVDIDEEDDDDENDDINELVAPKSALSTGSQTIRGKQGGSQIIKSPRGTNDFDFDFSQNSISDSQKIPKVLQSLRSSGDKLPVHLRNLDSDDESESYEQSARSKSRGQKSDADYDFYN